MTTELRYAFLVEALRHRAIAEQKWRRWDDIVQALMAALPAEEVRRAHAA